MNMRTHPEHVIYGGAGGADGHGALVAAGAVAGAAPRSRRRPALLLLLVVVMLLLLLVVVVVVRVGSGAWRVRLERPVEHLVQAHRLLLLPLPAGIVRCQLW